VWRGCACCSSLWRPRPARSWLAFPSLWCAVCVLALVLHCVLTCRRGQGAWCTDDRHSDELQRACGADHLERGARRWHPRHHRVQYNGTTAWI
jgi:hypothetical protein